MYSEQGVIVYHSEGKLHVNHHVPYAGDQLAAVGLHLLVQHSPAQTDSKQGLLGILLKFDQEKF